MFRKVTMSWTSNLVINFVNFLFGVEWNPHIMLSLIVSMYFSMSPMCSFVLHVCRCAGDKKISEVFELIITMVFGDGETPVLVLCIYFVYTRDYIRFSSVVSCLY